MNKIICKPRKWTQQAIECYLLGGVCSKCNVPLKDCQMKYTVIELVRLYGKPISRKDYLI